MIAVASAERPDLTIVGPELPLSLGIVDALRALGFRVFGPTRQAAMLETSKGFAKRFLQRHNIPTANYAVCASPAELEKAVDIFHPPIVVKADGLAAGKGVIICQSHRTAVEAAGSLFTGSLLGSAERQVVLEEFLEGEEISFLCLTDGKHVAPLVPAQDHKRIGEGDTGPNTGGMGVYSTDTMLDPGMTEWILHHIAQPTVQGMAEEETPFTGVLYCGLMMTARGPQVLEFNARFGDPETQAILMRLDSDLVDAHRGMRRRYAVRHRASLEPRSLGLRGGEFRRLSGQVQDGISDHRAGSRGPHSRGRGLSRRHNPGGRPSGHVRRPGPGRDSGSALA